MTASTTSSQKVAFSTVLQLANDPSSSTHYERHRTQLDSIVESHRTGWTAAVAVDGLPQVVGFMVNALAHDTAAAQRHLEPALIRVLTICSKPLQCTTLNDQRNHLEALRNVLEAVGSTLVLPIPAVRTQAVNVLRDCCLTIRAQCGDDLDPVSINAVQRRKDWYRAITSTVVRNVTDLWAKLIVSEADVVMRTVWAKQQATTKSTNAANESDEDDDSAIAPAAATNEDTPSTASHDLTSVCKVVLELTRYKHTTDMLLAANAPDLLLHTLQHCGESDRRTPLCVEMCWNALTLAAESWACCLGTREFLETFFNALMLTLHVGHKLKERELRNDIVVLLSLIADDPSATKRVTSDMVRLILCLSCGNERGVSHPAVNPKYHHTTSHAEDLQLKKLCWHLLAKLAHEPSLGGAILDWGFIDVLLMYIDVRCEVMCIVAWSTTELFDLQTSILQILIDLMSLGAQHFARCNGPAVLREYIAECPRHDLRNAAVALFARGTQTPIRQDFVSVGCVAMAIALLREASDFEVRINCLNMLADAVDRDADLQHQFGCFDGVAVVLPLLTPVLTSYTDKCDALLFAAVDCLWSCVFGCQDNERVLVESGGIDSLLQVVETCAEWLLPLPLSCLSDILQFPPAVDEARRWRSATSGMSAVQLLLATQQKAKPSRTRPEAPHPISRKALGEPPSDIRSLADERGTAFKVFSVLCIIGFEGHNELDASERAQLAVVEQFVASCKDKIWQSVEGALAAESVRPITPDRATLGALRKEADMRSLKLRTTRTAFDEIHKHQREEAERTFYKSLIKKTDEKKVSGTGRPLGLSITEAKIRKAQMLKQSLKDEHARALARATETDHQDSSRRVPAASAPETATQATIQNPAEERVERWGIGQRAMHETEYEVLQALNTIRTHPQTLIPLIREKMKFFNESYSSIYVPGRDPETSEEGKAVYDEAIQFLETVRPVVTLLDVPMGMLLAARDHAKDMSKQMKLSATGTDNSTPAQRLARYGECNGKYQQLISHGYINAMEIVMQLVIDDGVRSRIDRRTIFDPAVRVCGVAVGPNPIHGHMAVIMLANEYQDHDLEQQMDVHRSIPVAGQ